MFYVRLTSKTAIAGGGETSLLTGTVNTDYKGGLSAIIANAGDVFKLHAWGTWANPDNANGTGQIRLKFTPQMGSSILIADTTANIQLTMGGPSGNGNPNEWHFFAEITIRKQGDLTTGRGWCDSLFENVQGLTNFSYMGGKGSF